MYRPGIWAYCTYIFGLALFGIFHAYGLELSWTIILCAWWTLLVFALVQAKYASTHKTAWVGFGVAMIPISTMLLGNAMVPLYYVMDHSLHGGGAQAVHGIALQAKDNKIRVDVLTNVQRPLEVTAYTSYKQSHLPTNSQQELMLYLVNHSADAVKVKFKRTDVPAKIMHYIHLQNMPDVIELAAGEAKDVKLFLKTSPTVPRALKHAIIQINLMDASFVGEQGKQIYWEKMMMPAHDLHERMKDE